MSGGGRFTTDQELRYDDRVRPTMTFLLMILMATSVAGTLRAETEFFGNVTISGLETWGVNSSPHPGDGSPYIVHGSLSVVSGGHLVLEPGVEVRMDPRTVFEVRDGGTLSAEGSAESTITITADSGQFIGVRLWNGGQTTLSYCDISLAGFDSSPAVDIQSSKVSIDHCWIHNNAARGIQIRGRGLSPSIGNTTIENNIDQAIYQSTIDMVPTYQNLTISDNGTNAVSLANGELTRAVTLDGLQIDGMPFITTDTINVRNKGHLILNPGTVLKIRANEGLWVQAGGAMTAAGTSAAPAELTALDATASFIKLHFMPDSSGNLTHFALSGAGYEYKDHALVIESSDVRLNHCRIHDNKTSANGGARDMVLHDRGTVVRDHFQGRIRRLTLVSSTLSVTRRKPDLVDPVDRRT